jgi:hypothetical protein
MHPLPEHFGLRGAAVGHRCQNSTVRSIRPAIGRHPVVDETHTKPRTPVFRSRRSRSAYPSVVDRPVRLEGLAPGAPGSKDVQANRSNWRENADEEQGAFRHAAIYVERIPSPFDREVSVVRPGRQTSAATSNISGLRVRPFPVEITVCCRLAIARSCSFICIYLAIQNRSGHERIKCPFPAESPDWLPMEFANSPW